MPSAMTKLEAVNLMLSAVGEPGVASITGSAGLPLDATHAIVILDTITRKVQERGWHWNTEKNYPLTINENGHIVLSSAMARADLHEFDSLNGDPIVIGTKLYDKKNHTYVWTAGFNADVVWYRDFEEMPAAARTYCAEKAAKRFQAYYQGDPQLYQWTREDEAEASVALMEDELDTGDYNELSNPYIHRHLRRF